MERESPALEVLVEGTIRAIDPSNHTLTVMNDKNEEVVVRTDAATRIRVGDKEGTLADLSGGHGRAAPKREQVYAYVFITAFFCAPLTK